MNLGDMVVRITGDISQFNASLGEAEKRFNDTAGNIMKLGQKLTTFVTLPILALGAGAVKSAADIETLQAAFETMLGDATKAKNLIEELRVMGAKTPFQLGDLAEASKILLQFGVQSEELLPTLRQLGDVSMGNRDKLKSMAIAFGQIRSTGRLMGQDLLQLINAGFNPLQVISQKTGISMIDLKKKMEQGAISAEMVADAFKSATSEGGQFFGGMEKGSKTFEGLVSTLVDDAGMFARQFGEVLLPTLKEIVKGASAWLQSFSNLDESDKKMIITLGLLAASIGPIILLVGKLTQAFNFFSANPVILGLSLIAAAVIATKTAMDNAATETERFNKALAGTGTIEDYNASLKKINTEIAWYNDKLRASAELVARGVEIDVSADKEVKAKLETLKRERTTIYDYLVAAARKIEVETKLKTSTAEIADSTKLFNGLLTSTVTSVKNLTAAKGEQDLVFQKGLNTKAIHWYQDLTDAVDDNAKTMVDWAQIAVDSSAIAQQTFGDVFTMMGQDLVDNGIGWKDWAKIAIGAIAKMIKSLGQQLLAVAAFDIGTLNWGGAAIATGEAAVAFIAAGIVQGFANSFASGTSFASGGMSLLGEQGAELTNLPQGSQVYNKYQTDSMLANPSVSGGGDTISLVVKLDSRALLDTIFQATRNKTVLISAGAIV